MASVRDLTARVEFRLGRWADGLGLLESDPRIADPDLSDEGRQRRMGEMRNVIRGRQAPVIEAALLDMWGDPDLDDMAGGAVWAELDMARAKVREAKDAQRKRVDWASVAAESGRISTIVGNARNVSELAGWLSGASDAEALALAHHGLEALRGRFSAQDGLGGFLGDLDERRRSIVEGEQVAKAELRLEDVHRDAAAALQTLDRALQVLGYVGLGRSVVQVGRIRSRIDATMRVDGIAGEVSWRFAKRPRTVGMIFREQVAEADVA